MLFYRPGSTANVFRLSHTPLPFLTTRGRLAQPELASLPNQPRILVDPPRSTRASARSIICLYNPWMPHPPRASPMSCAALPSVHHSTWTVVRPTHTQGKLHKYYVRGTDACDTTRAIRKMELRRGCRSCAHESGTLSPDPKPALNQPAYAKTCPAKLIRHPRSLLCQLNGFFRSFFFFKIYIYIYIYTTKSNASLLPNCPRILTMQFVYL